MSEKKQIVDDPPPLPMTDDDVAVIMRKLGNLDVKQMNDLFNGYVQQIKGLVTIMKKAMNPREEEEELVELERLSRLINMVPSDEIFIRSYQKIWHARHHILAKDADWFLKRDYSANIKKDQKQTMIETIIRLIQSKYLGMTDAERVIYWNKGLEMLKLVATFKKLANV